MAILDLLEKVKTSPKPLRDIKTFEDTQMATLWDIYSWAKSLQELIFCIRNDITSPVVCGLSTCDATIVFSEMNRKYNLGCCKTHSQMINNRLKYGSERITESQETSKKRKTTFLEKYGVENPMLITHTKTTPPQTLYFKGVKHQIDNQMLIQYSEDEIADFIKTYDCGSYIFEWKQ